MMDLYKRNNIKPFRSMLTLVIQLPIFIALYTAVRVMVQPTLSDNLEKRAYSFVAQIDKVEEVISFQQPYLSYQQTLQNIRNDSNLSDEEKNQKISDTPAPLMTSSLNCSIQLILVFALALPQSVH